jgi:hypothetical protein
VCPPSLSAAASCAEADGEPRCECNSTITLDQETAHGNNRDTSLSSRRPTCLPSPEHSRRPSSSH